MSTRTYDNNQRLKELTKRSIRKAISRYNRGDIPFKPRTPQAWYIVDDDGRLYPLKNICALAIGSIPSSFQTGYAQRALKAIEVKFVEVGGVLPEDFDAQVRQSLRNAVARKKRLESAPRKPARRLVEVVQFQRNPDVVAEVLSRADGECERCEQRAPFTRRSDGTPYLEVHHIVQLAEDGDDTVENAIALCPNCHRRAHFG
jgi:5-methylcytosine-specific restriction protein A